MLIIIMIAIAYLIGSLSAALIVSKAMNFADPRESGSGNAGATNMLRLAGKKVAAMVLLGDMAKGLVAVLLADIAGLSSFSVGLVMIAVVLGHIFPVFFKFKGGKGVATALGAFISANFLVGIICIVIWVLVALAIRYASLASIIAVVSAPVLNLFFGSAGLFIPGIIIALIVIYKHLENIKRLVAGTENKLSF